MNFNCFGANQNSIDLNGKNHLNTNQITSSSFNISNKHFYANALRCYFNDKIFNNKIRREYSK